MHSGPISRSIDSGIVNVRPQRALVPNDEFRTDPGGAEEEVELPSKPPRRNLPFSNVAVSLSDIIVDQPLIHLHFPRQFPNVFLMNLSVMKRVTDLPANFFRIVFRHS